MDIVTLLVILLIVLLLTGGGWGCYNGASYGGPLLVVAVVVLLIFAFSGCAVGEYAVNQLPTAKYCSEVLYQRSGDSVTFAAQCTAPFGGM